MIFKVWKITSESERKEESRKEMGRAGVTRDGDRDTDHGRESQKVERCTHMRERELWNQDGRLRKSRS